MLSNRLLRPTLKNIKLPNDGKGFHHHRHRHLLPKLNITDETIVNNNNNKALESVKTRQLHLILKEKRNRNNNKNNNRDEWDEFADGDDDQSTLLSIPHEIRAVDKRLVGYGLKERNNYSIIFDYLRPNQACLSTTFSRSEKANKGSSSPSAALLLFSQEYWNKRVDDAVLKKRQIYSKQRQQQQQIQPLQRIINGSSDGIPHIFVDLLYAECNNNSDNNNSSLEKVSLWMGCNSDAMIQSGVFTAVYNRLRQIFDSHPHNKNKNNNQPSSSFSLREVTVSLDAKNCTVAREIVIKMLSEQQEREREEVDATTPYVKPKVNIVTGLVSDFSIGSKMLPNDGHVVIETDDGMGLSDSSSSGIIKIDRDPGAPLPFDRRLKNVRQFLQAYTSSMMLSKNSNNKNSSKNARNAKMILCYDCDPATCQYLMTPFSTMANNSQKNKKSKKKNTTTTRQYSFNYFSSNLDFVAEVSRLAGVVADHDETNNTDNGLFNIQHISNNIDNKNANNIKTNFDEHSSNLSKYLPASGVVDKSLIVYQLHIASKRGIQRAVNDLNDIIEKLTTNNNNNDDEDDDEIAMITLLAPRKIFTWPDEFPTPHAETTNDEQQDQKKRNSSNSSKTIFSSSRQLFNRILKKLSEKGETATSSSKVNFDLEIVRSFNSVSNDFPAKIYAKQQDNQSDDEIGDMTAVVISVVRK